MENGSERRVLPRFREAIEWAMCSTCSGLMSRKKRTAIPNPDEEVAEVVKEPGKMRDLMKAVLLYGPLQKLEPAEATKEQRKVLRRRRRVMMETKRCPACSGALIEACPASSREEFMAVLFASSQGGEEEEATMVADDARSEQKLKRSREAEGRGSSSGLKEKKKAKCEDKEGNGSMGSSKIAESSGSKKAKMKGLASKDDANNVDDADANTVGLLETVDGDSKTNINTRRLSKRTIEIVKEPIRTVGNRKKTKMETEKMNKKFIEEFIKNLPPLPPIIYSDYMDPSNYNAIPAGCDEINRVVLDYLECHPNIKGYVEYQREVTDDEGDDDHKLV